MSKSSDSDVQALIKEYSRELVAMRHHFHQGRLALMLGAGFSSNFNIPMWEPYLKSLARSPKVSGETKGTSVHLNNGQSLFSAYLEKNAQRLTDSFLTEDKSLTEAKIDAEWLDLLTDTLYQDSKFSKDSNERTQQIYARAQESYHYKLVSAFAQSGQVIVNYNFDDIVEEILAGKKENESSNVPVHSSWGSGPKRIPNKTNIYHPNGYLPIDRTRGSTHITLLESSFQAHIQDAAGGMQAQFAAFLMEHSCLLVGISLSDPTLCYHLTQCATLKPGHYHFCLMRRDTSKASPAEERRIRKTLLDLYNVIAVFAPESLFEELIDILQLPESDLVLRLNELGLKKDSLRHLFYLTGCVSSGKSTTISHLTGFSIFGEWSADMPVSMNSAFNLLEEDEIANVERFVNHQVSVKNLHANDTGPGLFMFDRCPLDAFAFTPESAWKSRAETMRESLEQTEVPNLVPGKVFILIGCPHEMLRRTILRGKKFGTEDQLRDQQLSLMKIYHSLGEGIVFIDTRGKSARMIVRELVSSVFNDPFVPADLDGALKKLTETATTSK